jgi:porin
MRTALGAGAFALVSLLASTAAIAQQEKSPGADQGANGPPGAGTNAGAAQPAPKAPDTLLGDIGGVRSSLEDAGVKLIVGYKGEFAANVSGGERKDATEVGQVAFTGTFDMGKIAGIEGGTFQTTITYRHGPNLTTRAGLNVLQQVQEVYGRGQTWRLTEFWYQQVAADGHLVLKAGRIPAGDFNAVDCDTTNLSFCGAMIGNLVGDYWFNYPISQWTGSVKVQNDNAYIKVGVNEDNRNNLDNAFFISRGGAKGVMYHAETGWTPTFGNGNLPGHYKVGAYYTTAREPDVLLGVDHRPFAQTGLAALQREGQYGVYVSAQQQITGSATRDPISGVITRTRGLNIAFNAARTDPSTSELLDQQTLTLYYNAPFKGRDKDHVGLAIGRTHYNGRAARTLLLQTPGSEKPKDEYPAEVYYSAAVVPGLSLRPFAQYIVNPGGFSRATDVVILGTRVDVNF